MSNETILIVDDEDAIRDMITMSLELAGYQCLHAGTALEAHEQISNQQPAAITRLIESIVFFLLMESASFELGVTIKRLYDRNMTS